MSQWYAIRSATNREVTAAKALEAEGVTVFLPMEARWGTRTGQIGRVKVERPLIRGYLFVFVDLTDEEQERIQALDAVSSFLGYTDDQGVNRPLPIPFAMILELQADERAGVYDRTLFTKVKYRPKKGDRVRVTAGPWLTCFGKVLASPRGERVHVMIEGPFGRGAIISDKHLSPAA